MLAKVKRAISNSLLVNETLLSPDFRLDICDIVDCENISQQLALDDIKISAEEIGSCDTIGELVQRLER